MVFLEIQNVTLWLVFPDPVTNILGAHLYLLQKFCHFDQQKFIMKTTFCGNLVRYKKLN